nr:zinc finger, CCHC-type [Tanacetum cinerariifolium]
MSRTLASSLSDPNLKTLSERGTECIFVEHVEHSKAFRFFVTKPNDLVAINSIIESKNDIFDENRFSSIPRPSLRIPNETEDIGGSVVPKEVTKEDDPKTFDKAIKSQDVAFWKEVVNDEMDSIMVNNTWVLVDLPPAFLNGDLEKEVYMNQPQGFIMPHNENKVCKLIKSLYRLKQSPKQWHQKFDEVVLSNGYLFNLADKCVYRKFNETGKGVIIYLYIDDMLIFSTDQVQVDLTKEFLSSDFSMKDMGEADVILVSTPMDTSKKLMPNNGQAVTQLEYSRVIDYLMYAMTCTRSCIAFVVGKLSMYTSNPATGKEAEWLKNLLFKILLWSKPITPISIQCDSAATLAKAYSQMYNRKSRHLGVRHSMIRELITNGVISIEFVRS